MKQIDSAITIIEDTAKLLVSYPEQVRAQTATGEASATVALRCHGQDIKKLVGSGGVMHKAIRKLADRMGAMVGIDLQYERVVETGAGAIPLPSGNQRSYVARENWPQGLILSLVERTATAIFGPHRVVKLVNGNSSSVIEILLPAEMVDPQDRVELQDALDRVFHGIGRAQGRLLSVKVAETFDLEVDEQPRTADGRYVKERGR